MRIINWFWRNQSSRDLGTCPGCSLPLQECPSCRGAWRAQACSRCQLGAVCPVHVNKWL